MAALSADRERFRKFAAKRKGYPRYLHDLRDAQKQKKGPKAYEEFLNTALKLQRLRNTLAHRPSDLISLPSVRPAYTLDESDNA